MDIFQALLMNYGQAPVSEGFKFTIKTDIYDSNNKSFAIPFHSYFDYPNPIEVDWGDGIIQIINNVRYPSHTYATKGTYQIAIKPINGDMMPNWQMFTYEIDTSTYFYSCRQILSIDTPMLKMEDLGNLGMDMFSNCLNLHTLCEKMLINNPEIIDLSCMFLCTTSMTWYYAKEGSLVNVPLDLFDYCPELVTVDRAFTGQAKLKNLPRMHNRKIIDFSFVAHNCESLQLTSNIFCADEALEKATRFNQVDYEVILDGAFSRDLFTGVKGTAPTLWDYTYPFGKSNRDTFGGAGNSLTSLTNYADIPTDWGGTA